MFATDTPLLQLRHIYHAVQYEMRCDACFATAPKYTIPTYYLPPLRMWHGYHKIHQNCLHWFQPPEHDAHSANTGSNSSQHPSAV